MGINIYEFREYLERIEMEVIRLTRGGGDLGKLLREVHSTKASFYGSREIVDILHEMELLIVNARRSMDLWNKCFETRSMTSEALLEAVDLIWAALDETDTKEIYNFQKLKDAALLLLTKEIGSYNDQHQNFIDLFAI
jgi:chemotaxis protein histidine kinase CheA